jgi:hypothetical protein
MTGEITADFAEMEKKLKLYVDKGRVPGAVEVKEEPATAVRPEISKIKPLEKVSKFCGVFIAVDCSTRTLKRANNWGVYLMRAAYASVKERQVDWGHQERLCTVVGDAYTRSNFLTDERIELESQMALGLLQDRNGPFYYEHTSPRSNYLLLDGGGYFGGERKFRVSLYERCEQDGVNLLAISKNSPSLHDEKGRDLIATTSMLSPHGIWVYHPIREADKNMSLYGDISLVKLCEGSPRVFRCDIMEYLTNQQIGELLAPLTSVAEDPRCLGYPIPLWLAHDFSAPPDAKLLQYLDQVEKTLVEAGIMNILRTEELSSSFADELHGVRYPFRREIVGEYV